MRIFLSFFFFFTFLGGNVLIWFFGFKNHFALAPRLSYGHAATFLTLAAYGIFTPIPLCKWFSDKGAFLQRELKFEVHYCRPFPAQRPSANKHLYMKEILTHVR